LYRLGVQGVKVLLLLGGFFCQVWLQHLSKIFDLWRSRCLLPPSSHHLGSIWIFFCWFLALTQCGLTKYTNFLNFFIFIKTCFAPEVQSISEKIPWASEKNTYSLVIKIKKCLNVC
jgi:hypothetical protein